MGQEKDEKEKKTEEENKELIKKNVEIKPDKPPVKLDLIGFGSFDVPL